MPLKNKKELEVEAGTLATDFKYVFHHQVIYRPIDFETGAPDVMDPERTIWVPLDLQAVERIAKAQFGTIFETTQQTANFQYMVQQHAELHEEEVSSLMVRTTEGLKVLGPDGLLTPATGTFIPNTLKPVLNDDPDVKAEVFDILAQWVDGEEQAIALLRHLATALAPHWSAVKYVLLIGDGRNGKSVLIEMMEALFGRENCSFTSRGDMSTKSPTIHSMNGKLLNLIADGQMEYLKDSGVEKTLIAGEVVEIKRLYRDNPIPVQTNALFIEGLNQEPKSRDKSSALQKRIVRFAFPNVFPEAPAFKAQMKSAKYTGALLSLLIDHYVKWEEAATMLAPTARSIELQLEHEYNNSTAVQYLEHLENTEPLGAWESIKGKDTKVLAAEFSSWRISQGDTSGWDHPRVLSEFRPYIDWKETRVRVSTPGQSTKGMAGRVRIITTLKEPGRRMIESMKGAFDEATTTVVEN